MLPEAFDLDQTVPGPIQCISADSIALLAYYVVKLIGKSAPTEPHLYIIGVLATTKAGEVAGRKFHRGIVWKKKLNLN